MCDEGGAGGEVAAVGAVVAGAGGDCGGESEGSAGECAAEARAESSRASVEREEPMTLGVFFWVIAVVAIVFGLWAPSQPNLARWSFWPWVVCILILGWQVFGAVVHR